MSLSNSAFNSTDFEWYISGNENVFLPVGFPKILFYSPEIWSHCIWLLAHLFLSLWHHFYEYAKIKHIFFIKHACINSLYMSSEVFHMSCKVKPITPSVLRDILYVALKHRGTPTTKAPFIWRNRLKKKKTINKWNIEIAPLSAQATCDGRYQLRKELVW